MSTRVIITGFMGSGKTTVGRLVAADLGMPFVDLDEEIVRRGGRSVTQIFIEEGEDGFRQRERFVALELLQRAGPWVLATGGGTLADLQVRAATRAVDLLVALHVSAETALTRVQSSGQPRPLLTVDQPLERARDLLSVRAGIYAAADASVQTEDRQPEQVAREVSAFLRHEAVPVALGPRGYPVYVGTGLLSRTARLALDAGLRPGHAALVCARAVARQPGGPLLRDLESAFGNVVRVVQAPGDRLKTMRSAMRIHDRLLRAGLERSSPVLALGGGVVSDLAGFVAATLLRGVPFVPIPTTLLSQADASVGGKVGVNHKLGKNLIGAFHQPRLVIADVDTLRTLPRREIRSGLAEIVKCGVIRDEVILDLLEARAEEASSGEAEALLEPLRRAIAVKARIVGRDERESAERRVLNFGHTFGHAVEAAAGYGGILHGEAVAIGMAEALRVGAARGVTPPALVDRTVALLGRLGLPIAVPEPLRRKLAPYLEQDKKKESGLIRFVLAAGGGRTEELRVPVAELS